MSETTMEIQGVQALVIAPDGEKLQSERDALDLINDAMGYGTTMVLVPVERLAHDFFKLETRLAGHFIQKFVQYRQHLVILGDVSHYVAQSSAFKAFVYETNLGNQLWFLPGLQELNDRLVHAS